MRTHLNIVGGGLGGLVTAIAAREAGLECTVYEARRELGGRARTTPAPYLANWGPHVVYSDGPLWSWLCERGLGRPAGRPPLTTRVAFRVDGQARRLPPRGVLGGIVRLRKLDAPVDQSFHEWAMTQCGNTAVVERIINALGVVTFDHDPGRLSAAFVNERLRRGTALPPSVRYIPGGWATLADRLAAHARALGARIETGSLVDRLPEPPVVLAIPLSRAAELLGDPSLTWTGTRTALLDLGLVRHRSDPFIISDLDRPGWVERFSRADHSLAPAGHELVQCQAGMTPSEDLDDAVARLEALVDSGFRDWQSREVWRRRFSIEDESGALDLPGTTWRDRPHGDRGGGVHVVGDMVACPGLLSEVAHQSALQAVARIADLKLARAA